MQRVLVTAQVAAICLFGVSCSWHTHTNTHQLFYQIIATFNIWKEHRLLLCARSAAAVCKVNSAASGIHKCLLYVAQREKKAKKVGEAAFPQEIRVFLKTNVSAVFETSPRRCKNLPWKDHLPCDVLTLLMWKRWMCNCAWWMMDVVGKGGQNRAS